MWRHRAHCPYAKRNDAFASCMPYSVRLTCCDLILIAIPLHV